jgi:glycosyltransferase involved in cell wall biosynthesis
VLSPGREGGLERVVTMLATGQARRDGGVHVAAVLSPGDEANHPFVERLRAARIPVTPIVVGARGYWREYSALRALARALGPDIVHTHGYRADAIGGMVARFSGIPTVSTVHGFTGGGRRNRMNERVQCMALRYADAVVAVSRPLIDRLAGVGIPRKRIHCVANGFAPSTPPLTRDAARDRLGIPRDALVAGWVGRLSSEKGPDVMLDAIAATDSAWRLSMLGDGREQHALHAQAAALGISARVTWHGSVADAASLFAAFDAFILSSRTEGTPIALLEAMAVGVPIVATRVGGVPDVVSEAEAMLVSSDHPDAIAAALQAIHRDPSNALRRADAARKRLQSHFGFESWLAAVERVYATAARAKGGTARVA